MQAAGEAALAASPQADMDDGRPSSPWPATSAAYAWPRKARDLLRILASALAAALALPFSGCCQELSFFGATAAASTASGSLRLPMLL